jgi:DNA-binding NarL/FixJ family response regulator
VAQGRTNNQIAAALGIAERTVDTHVVRIFKKLQISARGRMTAALGAEDWGRSP